MKGPVRHGDVSLHSAKLPKGAKLVEKTRKFTFAYGETTGHHHTLIADKDVQVFEAADKRYFVFAHAVKVHPTHPEHG